jgi:hypothetical protein
MDYSESNVKRVRYNNLTDGEKRLAQVKFEMTYGSFEHNLINMAMTEVNPELYETSDLMYAVLNYSTVSVIFKVAELIRKEHKTIRESLGVYGV